MKVSTEIDNNFGYEKITQLVDNIPLSINIKMRIVGFWNRLVSNEHKPSSHLYQLILSLHNAGVHEFKWIKCVQNIFNDTGLQYISNFQGVSHLYRINYS